MWVFIARYQPRAETSEFATPPRIPRHSYVAARTRSSAEKLAIARTRRGEVFIYCEGVMELEAVEA